MWSEWFRDKYNCLSLFYASLCYAWESVIILALLVPVRSMRNEIRAKGGVRGTFNICHLTHFHCNWKRKVRVGLVGFEGSKIMISFGMCLKRHCKAETYIINTLAKRIQTCSKVVNYVMAAISWTKSLTCDEDHINLKNGVRPLVRIFQVFRVKTQTRCPMKKKPSVENFSSPMAG